MSNSEADKQLQIYERVSCLSEIEMPLESKTGIRNVHKEVRIQPWGSKF